MLEHVLRRGLALTPDLFPDGFKDTATTRLAATSEPAEQAQLHYELGLYTWTMERNLTDALNHFDATAKLAEAAGNPTLALDAKRQRLGAMYDIMLHRARDAANAVHEKQFVPESASVLPELMAGYAEREDLEGVVATASLCLRANLTVLFMGLAGDPLGTSLVEAKTKLALALKIMSGVETEVTTDTVPNVDVREVFLGLLKSARAAAQMLGI